MAELPDTRIGTFEREQAVELLTRHLGDGRLSLAEFGDRCAQVEAARTVRELAVLFADLPAPTPPPTRLRFLWLLVPVLLVVMFGVFAAVDLAAWFVPVALVVAVAAGLVYIGTRRRRPRVPDFLAVAAPDLPQSAVPPASSRFGLVPYALVLLAPALMLRQPVVVLAAVGFVIFAVTRGIE